MANEKEIRALLDADPGTYGAMSDRQVSDYMMDTANGTPQPVSFITNGDLHEATDDTELTALSDAEVKHYDRLLWLDKISIGPGSKGRTVIARLFNAQSTTRAAIIALASRPRSIAEADIGTRFVRPEDVKRARA